MLKLIQNDKYNILYKKNRNKYFLVNANILV
jgi:hypothetical protein